MKKFITSILAIALLSVPTNVFAEDEVKDEVSKSTTVEFLKRDGLLLLKEFYPEVNIGGVKFQVLILTDVVTGQKRGCLRLETKQISQYTSDTYIGTLDSDELAACIQSLNYIKNSLCMTIPKHYEECEYRSRDGVVIGAYYSERKSKWEVYVQTKSYTTRSMKTINIEDVYRVISTMENAQNTIKRALGEPIDDSIQGTTYYTAAVINAAEVHVDVKEKTTESIHVSIKNNATQTIHHIQLRLRYLQNGSLKRIQMAEEDVEVNPDDQAVIVIQRSDKEKSEDVKIEVEVVNVK